MRGARRLPGPAIVVIPLGLAILGIECAWVRRRLKRVGEWGGVGERIEEAFDDNDAEESGVWVAPKQTTVLGELLKEEEK